MKEGISLQALVKQLAEHRDRRERLLAEAKDLHDQLNETELGQELAVAHRDLQYVRGREQELEQAVRVVAVAIFRANGEKKVLPGIGIRVGEELVYDLSDAVDWCTKAYPSALRVDARIFERAAKGMDLPFVRKREGVTPTIARDLSAYLDSEEEYEGGEEREVEDDERTRA